MTSTTLSETKPTNVLAPEPVLVLTPPEPVTPVAAQNVAAVTSGIKLPETTKAAVDGQLDSFLSGLLTENVQTDAFRKRLDSAFSLGRQEIASVTALSTAYTKQNFVGDTESPAYKAISEMRQMFDQLNPSMQGDLFAAPKVLGMPIPSKVLGMTVPGANKLKSYLRRYESAETQFASMYENISAAKLDVEKGISELSTARQKLYAGLEKLEGVVYFITTLDTRLTEHIETLRISQPDRARALEQEVLYYVRQNLGDVRAAQALTINAYNVFGELRKTGRETVNGCDRVATLGMSALSLGVTMAKATGLQIGTQRMLNEVKGSIEDLIMATGKAQAEHVKATIDFASNPILGVQVIQSMFDQTKEAMDTLEAFRTNSLEVQRANNQLLGNLVNDNMTRINNDLKATNIAQEIAL